MGGRAWKAEEGGRDSASSVHVAKAEKEEQRHLHIVPSSAMSLSPNQNVDKNVVTWSFYVSVIFVTN